MNVIQIKYVGVVFFTTIFIIIGVLHLSEQNAEVQKKDILQVKQELFFPNNIVSIPLSVSGIVGATDAITVYARTAGVLNAVFIEEGDIVQKNSLLFTQDTDVIDSVIALAAAQGVQEDTSVAAQYSTQLATAQKLDKTADFASTNIELQAESYRGTVQELQESLRLTLEATVTQLIATLDFLDANRNFLPAKSIEEYTDVLVTLYGSQPSYLNDGLIRRTQAEGDLLSDVYTLQKNFTVDKLLTVSEDVASQAAIISQILKDAESEFFDEANVGAGSDVYVQYLTHRTGVTNLNKNILSAQTGLIATLPQEEKNVLATKHAQVMATIDAAESHRQTQFAEQMVNDASVVHAAHIASLQSQKNLAQAVAPFDAVVEKVMIDEGQYLQPGEPVAVLQGSKGLELSVSVPVDMLSLLKEGQEFTVDDEVVGHVNRFSPVTSNGVITVFISLDTNKYIPGQVLTGVLNIESENTTVTKIPRTYIHFTTYGPFVYGKDREEIPVTIVYDDMKNVYIEKKDVFKEGIAPTEINR